MYVNPCQLKGSQKSLKTLRLEINLAARIGNFSCHFQKFIKQPKAHIKLHENVIQYRLVDGKHEKMFWYININLFGKNEKN